MNGKVRERFSLAFRGAGKGIVLGTALSTAYLVLIIGLMSLRSGTNEFTATALYAAIFGVLPSLLIGLLAGFLIGLIVAWKVKRISTARIVGGVIAGLACIPWLLLMLSTIFLIPYLIAPCIICVFSGAWLGQKIFSAKAISGEMLTVSPKNQRGVTTRKLTAIGLGTILATFILLIFVQNSIEMSRQAEGTVTEIRLMKWSNQPYGRCDAYVEIAFVDSPRYVIGTCSKELLNYLQATEKNPIEVEFARTYVSGAWEYVIKRVGNWSGNAEYFGLALHCFSNDTSCKSGDFPIREPYRIR